ncbi:hypothetical protein AB0P17_17230 [Streptomyces sp. NPDC088124]|uniref:hypothetical protein n=1 Tax=Streptomyces sp. NPDC088124 TaxID=3154654 RepID=UPI0034379440
MTVAALGAAQAAVAFLAAQLGEAAREDISELVKERFRRLFGRWRRSHGPEPEPEEDVLPLRTIRLGPAERRRIREVVHRQALDLGASREQAGLMADAIVGRLAVADPDGE